MSTEKIAAPSEGVESLRAAKRIVSENGATSSHILDAVIKVHIAAEKLLRNYLAVATGAPQEVRKQAMDFGAMSFPALVRAMVDHGKPSLKKWEAELLSLNATRNQHAHASGARTSKSEVVRFVALTEDFYQQYSDYKPTTQPATMNPNTSDTQKNPFVELVPASWWKSYPSDSSYRVVWLKGKKASVSTLGSHHCPVMEFDTVAFVWMNARILPITLDTEQFVSLESLPLNVRVELSAKPREDSLSLIAITTCFEASRDLLTRHLSTFLHSACRQLSGQSISQHEVGLANALVQDINSQKDSLRLPFELLTAHLQLRCPAIASSVQEHQTDEIEHVAALRDADRKAALDRSQQAHALEQLMAELKSEWEKSEQARRITLAQAKTQEEVQRGDLENLKLLSPLSIEAKIAALRHSPELASRIASLQEARISNDAQARQRALKELLDQFKAIAEVSRTPYPPGASPGINIVNNK